MASTGIKIAGTGASVDRSGRQAWNTPTKITADDTSYAVQAAAGATDYLVCSNFGFTLSTDAIIRGVSVSVWVSETGTASGAVIHNSTLGFYQFVDFLQTVLH